MKVVVDDKIPYLRGVLEPFAEVVYVPGKFIDNARLRDADALLVRTRTLCNEALLKDTKVTFIGTATIGFDHIDTTWCEQQGITWKNAPGCNAESVNQYIASALVTLSNSMKYPLQDRTLGIVGVGNVGRKVLRTAEALGLRVYLCDPPRVRNERTCGFISLEGILRECDILTFHVPLNKEGEDKTWHMINGELLNRVNRGTIIINSSRGEVADGEALKTALRNERIAAIVLDVWEHEPEIDRQLLSMCHLATPHIAGYSADGKARGTAIVIHELSRHFNLEMEDWETNDLPDPLNPVIHIDCKGMSDEEVIKKAILSTYVISEDDRQLRDNPHEFEKLRGDYPPRREFKAYTLELENSREEVNRICSELGFAILTKS